MTRWSIKNSSLLKRLQIAHSEKKNWKRDINTYLKAYRSPSHPMTRVSPAELLFGRRMRTKLPKLSDEHVEQEMCDRDSEQKSKSKTYEEVLRTQKCFPGTRLWCKSKEISFQLGSTQNRTQSWANLLGCAVQRRTPVFKQTSHAERLVQKSDTPSAQEEPTQQQSAAQVSNVSEPRTPSSLNLELQMLSNPDLQLLLSSELQLFLNPKIHSGDQREILGHYHC